MRECNTAVISGMKIANRIPMVHSEPYRHLNYMKVFLRVSNNYLAMTLYVLPYCSVRGATCWAHDQQELYIYSRVNSVSIYSKHYFKTLPTGSGVSDPSLRWCHAVKTEFEFHALTCINKPRWLRCGITEQLPFAKFQQGAPKSSPELLALVPATYKKCQFLIPNL